MTQNATLVQLILVELANRECMTIEELERDTKASREVLYVTLSRLHQRGVIYKRRKHGTGKATKEYCLKRPDEIPQ